MGRPGPSKASQIRCAGGATQDQFAQPREQRETIADLNDV